MGNIFRRPVTYATKVALLISLLVLLLVLAVGVNYWLTIQTVRQTTGQWCDTLDLLTRNKIPQPADPAANPSREEAYQLYTDFMQLKGRFGCG